MENILNKNVIKFDVTGALDFTQTLTIELFNEKINGSDEVPINDFLKIIAWEICTIVSHYIEWQVQLVVTDHHFHARPKNVWVRGIKYFKHSHESWDSKGKTEYLNFNQTVEELKGKHNGYKLELNGYSIKSHLKELKDHFGDDIMFHGKKYEGPNDPGLKYQS